MTMISRAEDRLGLPGGSTWFGVYAGTVTDVADPDGQGRIRVQLPWAIDPEGSPYEAWCRLVTGMAGGERGIWFIPEVTDEVALVFEAGDPRRPFVIGSLWNGEDTPPETMDSGGENNIRSIVSRAGIRMTMDDTEGQVTLTLETPGGQMVELRDGEAGCTVQDSQGNSIVLDSEGITVQSSSKVSVTASEFKVEAGKMTVNAGLAKFSGVVQASMVKTDSVVSTSYTPGAGNIW